MCVLPPSSQLVGMKPASLLITLGCCALFPACISMPVKKAKASIHRCTGPSNKVEYLLIKITRYDDRSGRTSPSVSMSLVNSPSPR